MIKEINVNPTPISKLLVTLYLSLNLTTKINDISAIAIVLIFAVFFTLNNKPRRAINTTLFFIVLLFLLNISSKLGFSFIKDYFLTFIIFIKIFFIPLLAGKFLIATSDVSSLIASMDKMHFPKAAIIPIAVIFRYFPAYKDDKKNIKMAMKMRGITFRNPIKYMEYVSVPLLISASNISDDISKAAETKCIADPCKKTRYFDVKFGITDIIFAVVIIAVHIAGRIYA